LTKLKQKIAITIIFLFPFGLIGQSLDSLQFVYQTIIDNPKFVKHINLHPDALCNGTLRFQRNSILEPTELYFQGKKVLTDLRDSDCSIMQFYVTEIGRNKYKIICNLHKSFPGEGCQRILRVTYSCVLKTKSRRWKFKKEKVDSFDGLAKFL